IQLPHGGSARIPDSCAGVSARPRGHCGLFTGADAEGKEVSGDLGSGTGKSARAGDDHAAETDGDGYGAGCGERRSDVDGVRSGRIVSGDHAVAAAKTKAISVSAVT